MGDERTNEDHLVDTDDFEAAYIALVDAVVERQRDGGSAMPRWQIEAQLQAIGAALEGANLAEASLGKRIGEGRYLALGAMGTTALSIVAGLIIHPGAWLLAGWKLQRLLYWDRDWRPKVLTLYARLEGLDFEVFETVHRLESEWIVTNFDKYEAEEFDSAFGTDAPDFERLRASLSETPVEQLSTTLASLVRRGVLKNDGTRYWIPL